MSSKLSVVCHQQGASPPRRNEYPFEIFRIAFDFDLQFNTQVPCRSLVRGDDECTGMPLGCREGRF